MAFELGDLIVPTVTIVGAGLGAYMSGRGGDASRRSKEAGARREATARACLEALKNLKSLLTLPRDITPQGVWVRRATEVLEILDDAVHVLPAGLRGLKASVRAAIGESLGGVALIQLEPKVRTWPIDEINERWNRYAWQYLDVAADALRIWRDASARSATTVTVSSFDAWLAQTGRYIPGQPASGVAST